MKVAVVNTSPGVTRVEELPLAEPAEVRHEAASEKGEQHVAASEEHGADLGEDEEQRPQTERCHGRRDAGCTSGDPTDLRHSRERPRR